LLPDWQVIALEDIELSAPFKFYRDEPRALELQVLHRKGSDGSLIADCRLVGTRSLPTGQELMQQSIEMARLQAEIARKQEIYAKRPKKKFISASTQAYEYASYMRAWVEKVERIGNLNFPEEARRQGLSGRLIMTVSVARDGSVKGVLIQRSSGRKILDDAAVRVVQLASPFQPLPHTSEDIDILEITRTWDYKNGSVESE